MIRRCIKSCGAEALPDQDLCTPCAIADVASRQPKRKRRQKRQHYVSVSLKTYERLEQAAARRGQSVRSLVAEVLA